MTAPRLSVVISFRNEEEVLPELIARLRSVLAAEREAGSIATHELIFVDDASEDGSEAVLRAQACGHDDLRLITMSRVFGVSPCTLAGMEHATGDLLVYMDADLQDPPEVIPKLLVVWRSGTGVDVIHTIRKRREGESRLKLAVTDLGYRVIRAVSSVDLPIEAGDFKLLTRRAVDHVVRFREKRPFLRGLACWIGFEQRRVEYVREPRPAGRSKFDVFGGAVLRNFIDSAVISFSDVPLKLSIIAGIGFTALAFLGAAWTAASVMLSGSAPAGATVLFMVLLMGGLNLIGIGILGLYVGSIFLEVKQRPNYIIKSTAWFEGAPREAPPAGQVKSTDSGGALTR